MNEKLQEALVSLIQRISDGAFQQLPIALLEVMQYKRVSAMVGIAWELSLAFIIYFLWRRVIGTESFRWDELEDGQCWVIVLCVIAWCALATGVAVDLTSFVSTFYPQAFALEYLRSFVK